MKPPPPMLPAYGCVTASAKPTATAASTALPPAWRISSPASEACASLVTTIPCRAATGSNASAGIACARGPPVRRLIRQETVWQGPRTLMPPLPDDPAFDLRFNTGRQIGMDGDFHSLP